MNLSLLTYNMSSVNDNSIQQMHQKHEKCSSDFLSHHCHENVITEIDCNGFSDCPIAHNDKYHHHFKSDVITELRNKLTKVINENSHLETELDETKHLLCNRELECEKLKAETLRQTALISSLQNRLNSAESRENSIQMRCDSIIKVLEQEKRLTDERCKELLTKLKNVEIHQADEECKNKLKKSHICEFLRKLRICLSMEDTENNCLSTDYILARIEELINELERSKNKLVSTCDTLKSCENELLNCKLLANIEKQSLTHELESALHRIQHLGTQCEQYEKDLQFQKEKSTEMTIITDDFKENIRVLEYRCNRLQNNLDSVQNDRLQFLKVLAQHLNTAEPCETLIKHKLSELINENKKLSKEVELLRMKLCNQQQQQHHLKENDDCCLKTEETSKCQLTDKLEKCYDDVHNLKQDHACLSMYLQRLAKAMNWNDCSTLGTDISMLAENLLERARYLYLTHQMDKCKAYRHYQQSRSTDKSLNHTCPRAKLRKEKSCDHIPLREANTTTIISLYNFQRKIRLLKEQIQRRDLHIELLKRKLKIIENATRSKCTFQKEHDETPVKTEKAIDSNCTLAVQLTDLRAQLDKARTQITESVDYKIIALERARHIDELRSQIYHLEEEKTYITSQLNVVKVRLKTANESFHKVHSRDESLIKSLRDDIVRIQRQLTKTKLLLSQLQSFRTAIARTLHLSDLSEADLLRRLQTVCSIHKEYTEPSQGYEINSPIVGHLCEHYEDHITCANYSPIISTPSQRSQRQLPCSPCIDNKHSPICENSTCESRKLV